MLQLLTVAPVLADTMRVAKDAIPDGNTCMALRDCLGAIFDDALFVPLFPTRGQPAATPWRLAVVTILQFAERLSDHDAAEAVRTRIDWKHLLGLKGHAEMSLLDRFLDKCKSLGMLRDRNDMRTDSTHVVVSIRNMNRSELWERHSVRL
jgi:transposase